MLSIVIPSWNNFPYLKACVDSIKKYSNVEYELLLHLNGGFDGSRQWAQDEGIKFTASDDNVGICSAVNQAAALATYDYIVFMNDDMLVLPGWDVALKQAIESLDDDCFLLSGTMIEPRETRNACVIVKDYGKTLETLDETKLLTEFALHKKNDWAGASWPPTVVSKKWWHIVGGYSIELSPGMASDTDFAMKMWSAGCRIFQGVGASRVYHFQCRSTGRVKKNDGGAQFLAKWGITQSLFNRYYLRRGQPYQGAMQEPEAKINYRLARIKSSVKRRFSKLGKPLSID